MYDVLAVDDYRAFLKQLGCLEFWKSHSDDFKLKYIETDSVKALDILRGNHIDILITDIEMPKMSGFELLTYVKNEKLCNCCILLSEHAEFEYARKALVLGAFDYIVKPVMNDDFERSLLRAAKFLGDADPLIKDSTLSSQIEIVTECIIKSGKGFEAKCDNLADACRGAANSDFIRNGVVLSDTALNIYNRVCKKFGWIKKLVTDPHTAQKKILQADDIRSSESFLVGFLREMHVTVKTFYPQNINSLTKAAAEYILANSGSKLSLAEVADACYSNPSYLSHTFKQNIGMSFVDYIINYKMQILRLMLTKTDMSLTEISENLGYDDSKYMGRLFKNVYGITPSEYRKMFSG